MPNNVVLNNVEHKDLKVLAHCSAEFGHAVGSVVVFPQEFRRIQCEFPILFVKNPKTMQYQSVAILGLQGDENLFLDEQKWKASYLPYAFAKGPFSVGLQNQDVQGAEQNKAVLLIDIDDKRVNKEKGKAVFKEFGGNTPYIEQIQSVLVEMNDGLTISEQMFTEFSRLDLLETVTLKLDIDADTAYQLEGYTTINADKLRALKGDQLQSLHQSGYLELAYSVIASLANMQKLVALKRETLKRH